MSCITAIFEWTKSQTLLFFFQVIHTFYHDYTEISRFSTKISDCLWTRWSEIQLFWINFFVHVNRTETSNRSLTCHFLGILGLDSPAVQTGRIWHASSQRWHEPAGAKWLMQSRMEIAAQPTHTFPFPACMFFPWHFNWSVVKLTKMAVCFIYSSGHITSGVRVLLSR